MVVSDELGSIWDEDIMPSVKVWTFLWRNWESSVKLVNFLA